MAGVPATIHLPGQVMREMMYVWYLTGMVACVLGLLMIAVAVRVYRSEARLGRIGEGRRLLEQALPRGLGISLVGLQIIVIGSARGEQFGWWPGVAGAILIAAGRVAGLLRGRQSIGRVS